MRRLNRLVELQDWPAVKNWTECMLATFPGDVWVRYFGRLYFWWATALLENRYEEAYQKITTEVVPLQPWYEGYLHAGHLGVVLTRLDAKWRPQAVQHLRKALDTIEFARQQGAPSYMIKSDSARAYFLLGEISRFSGNCSEAQGFYIQARATGENAWSNQASFAIRNLPESCPPAPTTSISIPGLIGAFARAGFTKTRPADFRIPPDHAVAVFSPNDPIYGYLVIEMMPIERDTIVQVRANWVLAGGGVVESASISYQFKAGSIRSWWGVGLSPDKRRVGEYTVAWFLQDQQVTTVKMKIEGPR